MRQEELLPAFDWLHAGEKPSPVATVRMTTPEHSFPNSLQSPEPSLDIALPPSRCATRVTRTELRSIRRTLNEMNPNETKDFDWRQEHSVIYRVTSKKTVGTFLLLDRLWIF